MNWALFRWTWQLAGPLYVGMPPAGSLNRTRLYVPARALWGAFAAELARREAKDGKEPQYQSVGESLHKNYRFTYLFPSEKIGADWRAWLPTYRSALGLAWSREDNPDSELAVDRQFRRRLLSTRHGTSIDATIDAADDGSLRETECIGPHWRDSGNKLAGPVAMRGYVLIRVGKEKPRYSRGYRRLDALGTLFVGGDTRYGLGCLHRVAFDRLTPERIFGSPVTLDGANPPRVEAATVFAHVRTDAPLMGGLELLGGWDGHSPRSLEPAAPLWQPGSKAASALQWTIEPDGLWRPTRD